MKNKFYTSWHKDDRTSFNVFSFDNTKLRFDAFFDSSKPKSELTIQDLQFVIDDSRAELTPNHILFIDRTQAEVNEDKKWDKIVSDRYSLNPMFVRPKLDNKYLKLDIVYDLMDVYKEIISKALTSETQNSVEIDDDILENIEYAKLESILSICDKRIDFCMIDFKRAQGTIKSTGNTVEKLQKQISNLKDSISSTNDSKSLQQKQEKLESLLEKEKSAARRLKRAKKRISSNGDEILTLKKHIDTIHSVLQGGHMEKGNKNNRFFDKSSIKSVATLVLLTLIVFQISTLLPFLNKENKGLNANTIQTSEILDVNENVENDNSFENKYMIFSGNETPSIKVLNSSGEVEDTKILGENPMSKTLLENEALNANNITDTANIDEFEDNYEDNMEETIREIEEVNAQQTDSQDMIAYAKSVENSITEQLSETQSNFAPKNQDNISEDAVVYAELVVDEINSNIKDAAIEVQQQDEVSEDAVKYAGLVVDEINSNINDAAIEIQQQGEVSEDAVAYAELVVDELNNNIVNTSNEILKQKTKVSENAVAYAALIEEEVNYNIAETIKQIDKEISMVQDDLETIDEKIQELTSDNTPAINLESTLKNAIHSLKIEQTSYYNPYEVSLRNARNNFVKTTGYNTKDYASILTNLEAAYIRKDFDEVNKLSLKVSKMNKAWNQLRVQTFKSYYENGSIKQLVLNNNQLSKKLYKDEALLNSYITVYQEMFEFSTYSLKNYECLIANKTMAKIKDHRSSKKLGFPKTKLNLMKSAMNDLHENFNEVVAIDHNEDLLKAKLLSD